MNKLHEFVERVAKLFPDDIIDMSQLDASDFTDRARQIWDLVEEARTLKITE